MSDGQRVGDTSRVAENAGVPDRVRRLKERCLSTDNPSSWVGAERIKMRHSQEFRDLPAPLQRARMFEALLRHLPITIDDDELIVGSQEAAFVPSYELYTGEFGPVAGAAKLRALTPPDIWEFWQSDPFARKSRELATDHIKKCQQEAVCIGKTVSGHIIPDFGRVLDRGLGAIIAEARKSGSVCPSIRPSMCPEDPIVQEIGRSENSGRTETQGVGGDQTDAHGDSQRGKEDRAAALGERDGDSHRSSCVNSSGHSMAKDPAAGSAENQAQAGFTATQRAFLESVAIACGAVIALAERYSALARSLADRTPAGSSRRAELLEIAEVTSRVPRLPARNFHEALQSMWFIYLAMTLEQSPNPYAFSVGRFDQFTYPFFKAGRESGALTRDKALELIECLWIKFMVGRSGWAVSQNILLGGVDRLGEDATNELSYLCLEASAALRLPQPSVSVRVHEGSPPEFVQRAAEVAKLGLGIPAFHNDESVIPAKVALGIPVQDARNYVMAGCQEPEVQGLENARTTAGKFNLAKCLELALNDGRSTVSGEQLGPPTGSPEAFTDYESVVKAFWTTVDFFMEVMVTSHNKSDKAFAEEKPCPFLSAIMGDCIEKRRDIRADGARYNFSGCLVHGLGTTADSLAAVKTVVFEQKLMSMAGLCRILRDDYGDNEPIRQLLLNRPPKYGNDDDGADGIAAELAITLTEKLSAMRNAWGTPYIAGFNTPSSHVLYGRVTGATPDGRKAGDRLSYGTGPSEGRNKRGATAVLRSVNKFPHWRAGNGTDISLSLHPASVAGLKGTKELAALVRSHFAMGGHHVMFNVMTADRLREAQKHPEEFKDLVVRVHGYSTYFTSLSPAIQEDLIARVEAGL